MPFDSLKTTEQLWEERRKSVAGSLRSIRIEELKKIAEAHQDEFVGDPWRDEFLRLITEYPHCSFYHAVAQEEAEVFYCQDKDFGFWVIPGSGSGPLDEMGKGLIKEVINASASGRKIGGQK